MKTYPRDFLIIYIVLSKAAQVWKQIIADYSVNNKNARFQDTKLNAYFDSLSENTQLRSACDSRPLSNLPSEHHGRDLSIYEHREPRLNYNYCHNPMCIDKIRRPLVEILDFTSEAGLQHREVTSHPVIKRHSHETVVLCLFPFFSCCLPSSL